MRWNITLLGCGASTAVPQLGCGCAVCKSPDPRNKRLRTSLLLQCQDIPYTVLIDTGPDLREQLLRESVSTVDAILYTHLHTDHTLGLNDLRGILAAQKKVVPLYANEETAIELRRIFSWLFDGRDWTTASEGRGLTLTHLHAYQKVSVGPLSFLPLTLDHGVPHHVLGFRFGDVGYVTDAYNIPDQSLSALKGIELLFLDCLGPQTTFPSKKHLTVERSIEYAKKIGAKKTILVHMSHDTDYERDSPLLPPGIEFGVDRLSWSIEIPTTHVVTK